MDEFGTLTCGCGEEYVETVLVQGWESEAVDRMLAGGRAIDVVEILIITQPGSGTEHDTTDDRLRLSDLTS